jgi:NitT/TauT family transport system substrate-binding protein
MTVTRVTLASYCLSACVAGRSVADDTDPVHHSNVKTVPDRQVVRAAYIPLADHYAGIVAYEKYRDEMTHADYQIDRMKSWPLLRSYFLSSQADVAFVMCPLAMDIFLERPSIRWVSLMHRDGNALAINDLINDYVNLPSARIDRKPNVKLATALAMAKRRMGRPVECGVPHLQATHTVVLYKFLNEHGMTLGLGRGRDRDLVAIEVPPPKSPAFIKKNNSRGTPASFEQSLPWADVVETQKFGHIAWYSKDVLPWPNGHVECIAIASDDCVTNKQAALNEVIHYIHKAGIDIEEAREQGGQAMKTIADMIRKHIPEHNEEAIIQSLRPDLMVINYRNLNLDKPGLKLIMDLAVEGGILKEPIDIDDFADERFASDITEQ